MELRPGIHLTRNLHLATTRRPSSRTRAIPSPENRTETSQETGSQINAVVIPNAVRDLQLILVIPGLAATPQEPRTKSTSEILLAGLLRKAENGEARLPGNEQVTGLLKLSDNRSSKYVMA
jgi:hypothetical protein